MQSPPPNHRSRQKDQLEQINPPTQPQTVYHPTIPQHPIPKKSHREHAVTFLTQPGESAKLITSHKKNLALQKRSARGVQRGRCSSVPFGIFLTFIKMLNFLMTRNSKSCHSPRQSQLIHMILLNTLLLSQLLLSSLLSFLRTADINLLRALCC